MSLRNKILAALFIMDLILLLFFNPIVLTTILFLNIIPLSKFLEYILVYFLLMIFGVIILYFAARR